MYLVAWYAYCYMFSALCFLLLTFSIVSSFMFLNSFQNMYSGMGLPSLPVSILYRISNAVLPACISKCAVISDCFLLKHNELTLTWFLCLLLGSLAPSLISTSCTMQLLLLLHTFLKFPILPHAAHIFPYAGHSLGA